jgi:hypothetical protein
LSRSFLFRRNPLAHGEKLEKVEMEEFGHEQGRVHRKVLAADGQVVQEWDAYKGGSALDPDDNMTLHGDRLVPRGQEFTRDGLIVQTVERLDDHGEYKGTYELEWEQTGEFQRTHRQTRRIFT